MKHCGKNTKTLSNAFFSWVSSEKKKKEKKIKKISSAHAEAAREVMLGTVPHGANRSLLKGKLTTLQYKHHLLQNWPYLLQPCLTHFSEIVDVRLTFYLTAIGQKVMPPCKNWVVFYRCNSYSPLSAGLLNG